MIRKSPLLGCLILFLIVLLLGPATGLAATFDVKPALETASIQGEVYFDANLNGMREPWERGMDGVDVYLLDETGRAVRAVITDPDGYYQMAELDSARYLLSVAAPLGYVATNNGSFSVNTSEVATPLVYSTAVNAGIYFPHILRRSAP